ncbi:MAG TPA: O-antigen ligase family protein [Burkholderiaceae bacterium]|nr:O-antigen ligase family protein [Burkholderiaceae bacterium]
MFMSLGLLVAGVPRVNEEASRYAAWLAASFVCYALVYGLGVMVHGGSFREMDKPIRFVVAAIVVLVAVRVPLRASWLIALLVAAAGAALGYAVYDRLVNNEARVGMFVNPIQFGVMAVVVSLMCVVLLMGLPARWARYKPWLWIGTAAALLAGMLSGSLTATLAVLSLPFLVFFVWGRGRLRRSAVVVSLLALMTIVGVTGARVSMADRITSNTARLENFSSAWGLFLSSPLIGVGRDRFIKLREAERASGSLSAYASSFNVAHNEYLDALAKRGLLGISGVLALFLIPGWLFASLMRTRRGSERAWAGAGLAATAAFALASLTQNVITHGSGSNMLAGTLVVCLCLALQRPTEGS